MVIGYTAIYNKVGDNLATKQNNIHGVQLSTNVDDDI